MLYVNNDAMFVKRNGNLYLCLPNEMSVSDGICNKDALCVKLEVRGTRGWHMKQDVSCRIALLVGR